MDDSSIFKQKMNKTFDLIDVRLICGSEEVQVPYATGFLDKGIYTFETRIADYQFYERCKNKYFKLLGESARHKIEAYGLYISSYQWHSGLITFYCDHVIKLISTFSGEFRERDVSDDNDRVFGFEIEGLKMAFMDKTEIQRFRNDGQIDDFFNWDFDHTRCLTCLRQPNLDSDIYIQFSSNILNGNIIGEFLDKPGSNTVSNKNFNYIKTELINFLAFINGNDIQLRKIFSGDFQSISKKDIIDAEIVTIYSIGELPEQANSEYLPINNDHSYSSRIFPHLFLNCFDKYLTYNNQFDLNGLVASLNDATNTTRAKERFYILITALEKLANNYASSQSTTKSLFSDNFFNDNLKKQFLTILEASKASIRKENPAAYNILKSRIGGLNRITKNDTKQKLYQLFDYTGIEVNSYIIHLVETGRNEAVHEGKVGENHQDALTAYLKLDHLLRDILLNIIGYDRMRKPRISYQDKYPYPTPWSN